MDDDLMTEYFDRKALKTRTIIPQQHPTGEAHLVLDLDTHKWDSQSDECASGHTQLDSCVPIGNISIGFHDEHLG